MKLHSECVPVTVKPADLKELFANIAGSVTVITCRGLDGLLRGFTANTFGPLSLEPPLVLFALAREAPSFPHFWHAGGFGVNLLHSGQSDISVRFARPHHDKFAGLAYTIGQTGAPLLKDVTANLECRTVNRYDGGDHLIFVGEVILLSPREPLEPLIYHRRKYWRLAGPA